MTRFSSFACSSAAFWAVSLRSDNPPWSSSRSTSRPPCSNQCPPWPPSARFACKGGFVFENPFTRYSPITSPFLRARKRADARRQAARCLSASLYMVNPLLVREGTSMTTALRLSIGGEGYDKGMTPQRPSARDAYTSHAPTMHPRRSPGVPKPATAGQPVPGRSWRLTPDSASYAEGRHRLQELQPGSGQVTAGRRRSAPAQVEG